MSRHRYPICPFSGKVRYRERHDTKLALRQAARARSRARMSQAVCSRREVRGYHCSDCFGWHLTSQPTASIPLAPVTPLTARTPGPAAEVIRRIAIATGLTTGTPPDGLTRKTAPARPVPGRGPQLPSR